MESFGSVHYCCNLPQQTEKGSEVDKLLQFPTSKTVQLKKKINDVNKEN
jgi:hypothetical protein